MDRNTSNKIQALVDEVHEQKKRIEKIERSSDLTNSAIDRGGITIMGTDGAPSAYIGPDPSGVVTTKYAKGPVPNQPTAPTVEAGVGSISVTWDGRDLAGNKAPKDFQALNIYASLEPDFEPDEGNFLGVIPTAEGGTKSVAVAYGTYYVRTAMKTLSDVLGPASDAVLVNVLSVVELPDVADEFAQGRADLEALEGKLTQADVDLSDARERLAEAEAGIAQLGISSEDIADRLAEAEELLASGNVASEELDALEQRLREAFAQADAGVLASAAEDAEAKADAAKAEATEFADELPKVLHGTTIPTGTAPNGSVWFQHQGSISGQVIGQWVMASGKWTSTPISNEAIANLDVGKLTAGSAVINEAVLNKVWSELGVFGRLTAGEAWIGRTQIKDGEITAEKITVTDELVTKILGAEEVVTEILAVNENLWARAAQIISLDVANLIVTEDATIDEAVINKIWSSLMVTDRLTAGEAWIGETVIKDGAITAPKIRADAVEASHIKAGAIDATKIQADAVTADHLATKAVKAEHMDFLSEDPLSGGSMSLDSSGITLNRDGSTIFQLTNKAVETIAITSPEGDQVVSLDNEGGVSGRHGTFDELTVDGIELKEYLRDLPRGIIARAYRLENPPNTQYSTRNDHVQGIIRVEFDIRPGYSYRIQATGLRVHIPVNDMATRARFNLHLRTNADEHGPATTTSWNPYYAVTGYRSAGSDSSSSVILDYIWGSSREGTASVLVSYQRLGGPASTEGVKIDPTADCPINLTVWEEALMPRSGKHDYLGSIPSAGVPDPSDNVVAPRRVTQTWTASAIQSWRNSSTYTSTTPGYQGQHMWQGRWSGDPNGMKKSHALFRNVGDKGKTLAQARSGMTSVEKLEVYLYNGFFYSSAGGTARLHYHNATVTSSYPSLTHIGDYKFKRGEGKWIEIKSQAAKDAFMSGAFTGIALDPRGSTSHEYYGYFRGTDGGSRAPKIRATYLTT